VDFINKLSKLSGLNQEELQQEYEKGRAGEVRPLEPLTANVDYIGLKDNQIIIGGAFVPREQFNSIIKKNYDITKTDYIVYLELCLKADRNGQIKISTKELAESMGYRSDSRVKLSLKHLEEVNLVGINRNTLPYNYEIIGFNQSFNKGSKGGFIVPFEVVRKLFKATLKDIRCITYLMSLRHHMPTNNLKKAIKLSTLRSVTNAITYEEVEGILSRWRGHIFATIEGLGEKVRQSLRGAKKVLCNFLQARIGIGSDLLRVSTHYLKDEVSRVLKRMNIKPSLVNVGKVIEEVEKHSEFIWEEMKRLSHRKDIVSTKGTVNCLISLIGTHSKLVAERQARLLKV